MRDRVICHADPKTRKSFFEERIRRRLWIRATQELSKRDDVTLSAVSRIRALTIVNGIRAKAKTGKRGYSCHADPAIPFAWPCRSGVRWPRTAREGKLVKSLPREITQSPWFQNFLAPEIGRRGLTASSRYVLPKLLGQKTETEKNGKEGDLTRMTIRPKAKRWHFNQTGDCAGNRLIGHKTFIPYKKGGH